MRAIAVTTQRGVTRVISRPRLPQPPSNGNPGPPSAANLAHLTHMTTANDQTNDHVHVVLVWFGHAFEGDRWAPPT